MKKIISLLMLVFAVPAFGCDEACKKDRAETQYQVDFPSYVTMSYCGDLKNEFMTYGVKSLRKYSEKHIDPKITGGIRNTKQYIADRKDWLAECDQYLKLTEQGRIFADENTTQKIFTAMGQVNKELDYLMQGVSTSDGPGNSPVAPAQERFEKLFRLVDEHYTVMQLKGQFDVNSARNG